MRLFGLRTKEQIEEEMNNYLVGWRTKLSDYETQQLIPLIKERVSSFQEYFERIQDQCEQLAEDRVFVHQLANLMEKSGRRTPGEHASPGSQQILPRHRTDG